MGQCILQEKKQGFSPFNLIYLKPNCYQYLGLKLFLNPRKQSFFKKKLDNIVLLGDFNCHLQGTDSKTGSEIQPKTARLLTLFQLFGMQNIVNQPTKITLGSSTLIDLIVTTKPNLINRKGVVPLGLSDHCLIYATLNLKLNRPPLNVIDV